MIQELPSSIHPRTRIAALVLIVLGACVAVGGLYTAPHRTWPNLLLNGFYFTSLALSAALFLAAQRLTGAHWSASLRRLPEAFMMGLPAAAVLILVLFFGRDVLYPWARASGLSDVPALAGKVQYLHPSWVFVRAISVFAAWLMITLLMRRASLDQDRDLGRCLILDRRLTRYSGLFVVVFAATFSVSAFDWILSLEPQWFSTMFAIYLFAGTFVQGIAAVTLAAVIVKDKDPLRIVGTKSQLEDLGRLLFAFSTFWAYIWTCQYLLIWYGDIPLEVTHYVKRTNDHWIELFGLNLVMNWLIPFIALLSVRAKSSPIILTLVSVVLLVGHWLDLYLLIMPAFFGVPEFGLPELLTTIGYAALFYRLFIRSLAKAPLVPLNDPTMLADTINWSAFEGSTQHTLVQE